MIRGVRRSTSKALLHAGISLSGSVLTHKVDHMEAEIGVLSDRVDRVEIEMSALGQKGDRLDRSHFEQRTARHAAHSASVMVAPSL